MKTFLLLAGLASAALVHSQSIGINSTGAAPHASAMLDVSSTTKGLLAPRMTAAQRIAIVQPATGLMVYQTDGASGLYLNAGTPGAPAWQQAGAGGWSLTGNAGTNAATHFIGTTDNVPLHFRVWNESAGRIGLLAETFFGVFAGRFSTGLYNTGFGAGALSQLTTANNNTAVGASALALVTEAPGNTAVGYSALNANTGANNTAVGTFSLQTNSTGYLNTAIGYSSLQGNTSGYGNVAVGENAMALSGYSLEAVAVGREALKKNSTANTPSSNEGRYNTALGTRALTENSSGYGNTAAGWQSLRDNNANGNTAMGMQAMTLNQSGAENSALGMNSLFSNLSGGQNVAIGVKALYTNGSGFGNTAVGYQSLYQNTSTTNTAVGWNSGAATTIGDGNVFVGYNTGANNTSGRLNTAMGRYTLNNNTTGQQITALGIGAETGSNSLFNATAVGAFSQVDCNNCMVLGSVNGVNSGTSNVNVGIGVNSPIARLHIKSNSSVTTNNQLVLQEDENDYARLTFFNAPTTNFWTMAGYANSTSSVARINFYYSLTGDMLSLLGNGNATLAGTLTQNSDARLKTNILPVASSLENLQQLTGYNYNWKNANADQRMQYGLLAQEVQKTFPLLVSQNEKGELGVNYIGLVPVMVNAIKEQQQQIAKQNELIELLLKRIDAIEKTKK